MHSVEEVIRLYIAMVTIKLQRLMLALSFDYNSGFLVLLFGRNSSSPQPAIIHDLLRACL